MGPLTDDSRWTARGNETYWGEPTTEDEHKLVDTQQDCALFNLIAYGV
jgi:hypothetical protein